LKQLIQFPLIFTLQRMLWPSFHAQNIPPTPPIKKSNQMKIQHKKKQGCSHLFIFSSHTKERWFIISKHWKILSNFCLKWKEAKKVWMKNSLKFDMYFRMLCFETFAFFSKKKILMHECMRCILLLSLMFIYNSSWKELVKMALASKTFVFNKD